MSASLSASMALIAVSSAVSASSLSMSRRAAVKASMAADWLMTRGLLFGGRLSLHPKQRRKMPSDRCRYPTRHRRIGTRVPKPPAPDPANRLPLLLWRGVRRSEEHTSELQSLMRISYAVLCLKKKKKSTEEKNGTEQQHEHTILYTQT